MSATAQRVAVDEDGLPADMIIGDYFFYSVKEAMLSLRTVRKAFADHGLDTSRLPTERRLEHVAQESVRKTERVVQNGQREEIRVEHPIRDGQYLVMQVTRHVQHKEQRLTEHPKALRILFDFETEALIFEPLDGATRSEVASLVEEIQERFDKNSTKIPGHKLRTILRHYVEAAGAENIRGDSGGLYWMARQSRILPSNKLHAHHGDAIDGHAFLEAIKAMLTQLYGPSVLFHRIPCANAEGQREFLKRRFLENITEDMKLYRDECLELVRKKRLAPEDGGRTRGFRADLRAGMVERRKEMDVRRERFAAVLGDALHELERDMELADKALSAFLTEADA